MESSEPAAAPPVAGKPVKRRVLGETGWIQVTTEKGLKYYVNITSRETTWIAPPVVTTWLEQRRLEKAKAKEQVKKQEALDKKLTEEEQLQAWVDLTRQIIETKKIPPIITFDRAQARLCADPQFLQCPSDKRQEVFELAKKLIISKGSGVSVLAEFERKLAQLKERKLIRHDHTVRDVFESYFSEDKWLSLRENPNASSALEKCLAEVQDNIGRELETLMPEFRAFTAKCFLLYLKHQVSLSVKPSVKELIDDNDFVIKFTEEESLDQFKEFVQSFESLSGRSQEQLEKDRVMWGKFLMILDPSLINELLIDTWQAWCQKLWQDPDVLKRLEEEESGEHTGNGDVAKEAIAKEPVACVQAVSDEVIVLPSPTADSVETSESRDREDGALSETPDEESRRRGAAPRPGRGRVSCIMADRLKKRPLENHRDQMRGKRRHLDSPSRSRPRRHY
eukprot:Blabericola_migrator_1__8391@NODE_436_length_8493_cov_87_644434_g342_i0_p3_GENE_NODE_436_length_8493_cov_87_644434_g342_i0NODE_436_length_8493_cov_87_644434_g342_i0_p3_ORF_typecomplete_len451_score104_43WW/PF00397_26/2_8e06FF/PF01846_19/0_34FF/PF01846_19/1_3e03_NODE_436_length_8493_cov_87_644434_g342_i0751427